VNARFAVVPLSVQVSPLALVLMSNGPYALNVTFPVGLLAPLSVAVSLIVFELDSVWASN